MPVGGKSSLERSANLREFILKNAPYLALAAAVVALAVFAFVTDAPAYAGTASATCANCHVMDSMYENYYHAAHHAWAVCADCHLPHTNIVAYYFEKGRQGMHDVYVFGTGQTPPVIHISDHSKSIVQQNCVRCHESAVESIMVGAQPFERDCWECHRNVAHGPRGAAVVPYQDSSLYLLEHGE
jgi:cytochrome c nitrite reductase small subunit